MAWQDIIAKNPQRKYVAGKLYNAIVDLQDTENTTRLKSTWQKVNCCMAVVNIETCKDCGTQYYDGACYCKNKLCPVCAMLREKKYMAILRKPIENFVYIHRYKLSFLTLTISDTPDLKSGVELIKNAWRYMTHQDTFSKYHFDKMFVGGMYSIEIKKGKNSHLWHPHMHLLVLKDRYSRDFEKIKGLWENAVAHVSGCFGKKTASVHIEGVYNSKGKRSTQITDIFSIGNAISECIKYVTKFDFNDYSSHDLLEMSNVMFNNRLFSTFGCLRGLGTALQDDNYEPEIKEEVCVECGSTDFESDSVDLKDALEMDLNDFKTKHNQFKNEKIKNRARRKIKIFVGGVEQ